MAPGAYEVLARIRAGQPVVHCLTNAVTVGRVADALAALGALPVMASAPEEAAEMAARAQALVLNLGTPSAERWTAARAAGRQARECGIPVIVDPVGCSATRWRTAEARGLIESVGADVVRGNVPEVASLAGIEAPEGAALRGIAASGGSPDLERIQMMAREAAERLRCTVVVTGQVDVVAGDGGSRVWRGGVPALAGLVGAGDVLTAVIAACRAVEADGPAAAWAGLALFTAAARRAAERSPGPGTFWPAFMDGLAAPTSEGDR